MSDYLGIVEKVNKDCKILFSENFRLVPISGHHNIYVYRVEGGSYALNRVDAEPVKVLKWFDNFWLYLEIKFILEKSKKGNKFFNTIHTNISLSIYEGEDGENRKIQLFRAEWDDMNNIEEKHSQPHWHITSSQAIEKTFEEYSNTLDDGEFVSLLSELNSKIFDVKQIHFAMNGNWQENKSDVHPVTSAEQVSNWLRGLLTHIRKELQQ